MAAHRLAISDEALLALWHVVDEDERIGLITEVLSEAAAEYLLHLQVRQREQAEWAETRLAALEARARAKHSAEEARRLQEAER